MIPQQCRKCKGELPKNAPYCPWCGEKQFREPKKEISVPKPTHRGNKWTAQLMQDGKRTTVSASTEAEYYAKARAIKAGLIETETPAPKRTLESVVQEYFRNREQVLSPTTLRMYHSYWKNHFLAYHERQIGSIDFQGMINSELQICSPAMVKKCWSMVKTALGEADVHPRVKLAPVAKHERQWLTDMQIKQFIPLLVGEPCELTALLALHSLRESEIGGLMWGDYNGTAISVRRALVRGEHGMVIKDTPKTAAGYRTVPIFISRLKELLDAVPPEERTGYIVKSKVRTDSGRIKRICMRNDLGEITNHCLRHSFATLCHRLRIPLLETKRLGGWSDIGTIQKIYTHLDELDAIAANTSLQAFFTAKLLQDS